MDNYPAKAGVHTGTPISADAMEMELEAQMKMKMSLIQSKRKQPNGLVERKKRRERGRRRGEDATGGVAIHMWQAVGSGTVRARTTVSKSIYSVWYTEQFFSGRLCFPSFSLSGVMLA